MAEASSERIIWTLPAIAQRLGTGVDFIRDNLAKQEGTPIRQVGGRYFAFEEELFQYLKGRDGKRT